MPKIQLKNHSPEFAGSSVVKTRTFARTCDMPGCTGAGEHRAPKDRSLSTYYWFCLDHVQEYNAAWDFFDGMQAVDVEQHIIESLYGDRPTWRSDSYRGLESELHRKINATYHFTEDEPEAETTRPPTGNPELDALSILNLTAPVTFEVIKKRYRELVKKYHPDHNKPDPTTEELIKKVNMAYTILKMAHAAGERA